jgi:hypothetical protein
MSFLDAIPLDRLLWLVPIFLAIHNLEEAPGMERWSRRLPIKLPFTITTRQFTIAVTFLTLAGFIVTYFCVNYLGSRTGFLLVLGIQMIMLFNAFIPHVAATIRYRMYSPGVITAIFINIPFSLYLFHRALDAGIVTWTQLWILLAIAPFATVLLAYTSLQIGLSFEKQTR